METRIMKEICTQNVDDEEFKLIEDVEQNLENSEGIYLSQKRVEMFARKFPTRWKKIEPVFKEMILDKILGKEITL